MPVAQFLRVVSSGLLSALLVVSGSPAAYGEEATHTQSNEIVVKGEHGESLQTFCLGPDGRIYALLAQPIVYGAGQKTRDSGGGEVHVLDADGKQVTKWSLDFAPQRIGASPAGEIIVGGDGRLARFTPDGKLAAQSESPHLAAVLADKDGLRKAAEEQRNSSIESYTQQLKQFDDQVKELEAQLKKQQEQDKQKEAEKGKAEAKPEGNKPAKTNRPTQQAAAEAKPASRGFTFFGLLKGDDADTDTVTITVSDEAEVDGAFRGGPEVQLSSARQMAKMYRQMLDNEQKQSIEDVMREISQRLQRIHGIAAGKNEIFVATAMSKGYGFAIWRMTPDFKDAKQIVTGLSGCCGQIDIQCEGDLLFAAENSRHRVVSYDREGKRVESWGKRDRDGEGAGFGGCCNPMNLAFLADGAVLTSESEGLVKRFSKTGEFLGLVGKAKVSGGCKNVAIGATGDGSRIYFYDLQGSKIMVLSRNAASGAAGG
jgi:hypothetical protein